ncbi:hypothetical protein CBR_g4178 [Chara braunii]|uniref:Myb-like domain-containing protein n=1 Tax=Chara braunii TaxID=69332 RepID=A0A388KHD7_CHABU|nr:hypothetical protein CBR_g4178 [Chara braunii]|eukprot:GBG69484.1 hypothetical protein CBR_g4178 [Chara braunii]
MHRWAPESDLQNDVRVEEGANDNDQSVDDVGREDECGTPMAEKMPNEGEALRGQPTEGRGRGRGQNQPQAKEKRLSVPWILDERVKLVMLMGEDNALMVDANGPHRFKSKKDQMAFVHDHMSDVGFKTRSVEDCRKKWRNILLVAKIILEACNTSRAPSYSIWDMSMEERKENNLPLAFDRPLWDAMQWQMNRPSMLCDVTLAFKNLGGKTAEGSALRTPTMSTRREFIATVKIRLWRCWRG